MFKIKTYLIFYQRLSKQYGAFVMLSQNYNVTETELLKADNIPLSSYKGKLAFRLE